MSTPSRFPFRLAARLVAVLVGVLADRSVTPEEVELLDEAFDGFSVAFGEWREARRGKG
jgi:hypothetical protein